MGFSSEVMRTESVYLFYYYCFFFTRPSPFNILTFYERMIIFTFVFFFEKYTEVLKSNKYTYKRTEVKMDFRFQRAK